MSRVLHAVLKRIVISNSNIPYSTSFRQRFLQDDNDRRIMLSSARPCLSGQRQKRSSLMTALVDDLTTKRQHHEGLRISTLCEPVIDVTQVFTKSRSLNQKQGEGRWRNVCRHLHARIHVCRQYALHRSSGLMHRLCLQRTRGKDVRCDKRGRILSIRASTTRGSWWYATICPVIKNRYTRTSSMDIQDQREDHSQRYDSSHIHNCH